MICSSAAIVLHLWSLHTRPVPNDSTFGIGLECNRQKLNYQIGYYDNSYNKPSFYAAVGQEWGGRVKVGIFGGVVTGYKDRAYIKDGLSPLMGLSASYRIKSAKVGLQVAPTSRGQAVVHLTLSHGI